MRLFRASIAILLISIWTLPAAALAEAPIDIVFDLDWTLIYTSRPEDRSFEPENIVGYEGTIYRFSDHAVDVLLKLHQTPPFRVSIFSGGFTGRNKVVLDALYRRINARAGPGHDFRPFVVADNDRLSEVKDAPPGAKFSERFKKDMTTVIDGINLERALLVDDLVKFAASGQEPNLLWLQKTYEDLPDFHRIRGTPDPKYTPKMRVAWALERNKLAWVLGTLLQAQDLARREGVSFLAAVHKLTRDPATDDPILRSKASQLELIRIGLRSLGLADNPLQRFPQDELAWCKSKLLGHLIKSRLIDWHESTQH